MNSYLNSKKIYSLVLILFCSVTFSQEKGQVQFKKVLDPKGEIASPSNFEEKFQNFMMSKRFKRATAQRDSIFISASQLLLDTTDLYKKQRSLLEDIDELNMRLETCNRKVDSLERNYQDLDISHNKFKDNTQKELAKLRSELDEKAAKLDLLEEELIAREKRVNELEQLIKKQDSIVRAINQAIKDALLQFNSSDLSVEMRNGKVYVSMNDKILFKSGKSKVQEEGIVAIGKLADILNKIMNVEIMIEGHTDNIPIKTQQYEDNWDLSVARATAITRLMIEMGVKPERITASGKAEFSPKASNMDADGRSKNRRTEIVLVPNLDEFYKILSVTEQATR